MVSLVSLLLVHRIRFQGRSRLRKGSGSVSLRHNSLSAAVVCHGVPTRGFLSIHIQLMYGWDPSLCIGDVFVKRITCVQARGSAGIACRAGTRTLHDVRDVLPAESKHFRASEMVMQLRIPHLNQSVEV